jgi:GntR family transcriptional regulator
MPGRKPPGDKPPSGIQAPGEGGPQLTYMRVAEDITARIHSGELRPGVRLLSERDLATHYGVAFHTIRSAMKVLRERGLIVSVHGRGTFVQEDLP